MMALGIFLLLVLLTAPVVLWRGRRYNPRRVWVNGLGWCTFTYRNGRWDYH